MTIGQLVYLDGEPCRIAGKDREHPEVLLICIPEGERLTKSMVDQLDGTYQIDMRRHYKWCRQEELEVMPPPDHLNRQCLPFSFLIYTIDYP